MKTFAITIPEGIRNNEKVSIEHPNVILTDVKTDDLSSTFIRKNIGNNKYYNDLLDDFVLKYIKERNLYERDS